MDSWKEEREKRSGVMVMIILAIEIAQADSKLLKSKVHGVLS